jgi:hypothetical protein
VADDVEALRAERDALREEVDVLRGRRGRRLRGVLAVVGVVLSCVLLVATVLGVWARRSFLKTEVFSERAGGLIDEPEVQVALSTYLTNQISTLIDVEDVLRDVLPERGQVLAGPLTAAVEGFVGDQVTTFVASDTFAELWKGAVAFAHSEAVRVLEGDTPLVEESEDRVVINLLPVINGVLARIGEASPEILGRDVDLPTVTVDDVPDEAREAIAGALGVTLDEDFGTFTIYDEGALTTAQEAVDLANRLLWVLVVLTPLVMAGTVWVSARRRRTIIQLGVGVAFSMVLVRRLVYLFQEDLLDLVRIETNRPAVEVTTDAFLDPLLTGALWIGIAALVLAAVAAVTGPYAWAVALRRRVAGLAQLAVTTATDRAQDEATIRWISDHVDGLRVGGLVVGLMLFWWLDLSWLGFFLLAALVAGYELLVARLAERAAVD